MLLFIPMLPESATSADLRRFICRTVRPGWLARFMASASIVSCRIMRLPERHGTGVEHHGLVEIEPEKTALAVIRKLNGTHWKGSALTVRAYQQRRAERDRRGQQPSVRQLAIQNRRAGDRRRPPRVEQAADTAGEIRADELLSPVALQGRRDRV